MSFVETGEGLRINKGKKRLVQWGDECYLCFVIKSKVVSQHDRLADIIKTYAEPVVEEGDILFVSEKMVACAQGRAIPLSAIEPCFFARFLSRFVTKSSAGIGLSMPETMQCAIDECGVIRIVAAAAVGMAGKLLGKKGWFYRIAGYRAACIDGPCNYTIPPYNQYVVLAPLNPDKTAATMSRQLGGMTVLIIDANDIGVEILGSSHNIDTDKARGLLKQNPLGQSCESTPMGILRLVELSRKTAEVQQKTA
ncbi:MAG: coenzyme F420-0:L-glutamate ligase [Clostridiales bacterium]|nr:coenzyme F420-0:L-glutamate ligase [Clostridiales bacterium]